MMKRKYLPLALNVAGRSCLVVGSDREAVEKAERLRDSGADVSVISAVDFKLSDIDDQFLVMFSIQGDRELTKSVFDLCRKKRILLCAIDQAEFCDLVNMSLYERGPLRVAISTDAIAPALARKIRLGLEASLAATPVEEFMEHLKQVREKVVKEISDPKERREKLIDAVKDVSFEANLKLPTRGK